jgi:hypothetical protein
MTTDENGEARFQGFDAGRYSFRADYQAQGYWSDSISYPQEFQTQIQIDLHFLTVSVVNQAGYPVSDVSVFAFTDQNAYVGVEDVTNENGETVLPLVSGSYKIRADYKDEAYWSTVVVVPDTPSVVINVGLPIVTVKVIDVFNNSVPDVQVYAYRGNGKYLGVSGKTNASGEVVFELKEGTYRFRVYYQGRTYKSEKVKVPTDTYVTLQVGERKLTVNVVDQKGKPIRRAIVYVFYYRSPYYYWTRYYGYTNRRGIYSFDLNLFKEELDYRVLAYDYRGSRKWAWSTFFNVPPTTVVDVTISK